MNEFKRLQFLTSGPRTPCGPSGPCSPLKPPTPCEPGMPLIPTTPGLPSAPAEPTAPLDPLLPYTVEIYPINLLRVYSHNELALPCLPFALLYPAVHQYHLYPILCGMITRATSIVRIQFLGRINLQLLLSLRLLP